MSKILIGVPSGASVPVPFQQSLPDAVKITRKEGKVDYYNVRGTNTVTARNKIVYYMLQRDFTHLLFLDSDMWFPKKSLSKLLADDKDIVGGFYVRKRKGFLPNAFTLNYRTPDGKYMTEVVTELKEVEAIGTGCLLVRREVFEKLGKPWFEYHSSTDDDCHMVTEDLVFCEKAKEAGYQVWCDGTIQCGHVGSFIIQYNTHKKCIEVVPV